MRRAHRTLIKLVGLICLVLLVSPAQAQNAKTRARARQLYAAGQELFREGEYAAAQRAFEQAYEVLPNPVVLLSIAECQVRTEEYAAAVQSLERYLEERPDAPDRAAVQQQIEALKTQPAALNVESIPSGAGIWLDGEETGKRTPAELQVAPGVHSLVLDLPGYARLEHMVSAVFGGRERLELRLSPQPEPQASTDPEQAPVVPSTPRRQASPAVWVATGFTAAGVISGAVLGGLALKKKSEYDQTPTEKLADKGERVALFADVSFGVAAAAGITALVLYLTSGEDSAAREQAWAVSPAVRGGRYGLVGKLRF